LIPSEVGLEIPAFLLRPTGQVRGLVVAVHDRGKEALAVDPILQTARRRGWAVCGLDPRGIGESATDKTGWVFAVSLLLGENFVGRQAWDIGRALEALLAAGAYPGKPVALYARGPNASLAATYAIARASNAGQAPLRWYLLREGFLSYRSFIDRPQSLPTSYRLLLEDRNRTTAFDREIPATFFAFNALRWFDLPDLLAASQAEGLVVNPVNGDWERLPPSVAQRLLPPRIRIVSAAEPGDEVEEFLQAVLGERTGTHAGRQSR
jgi:alpha-beta hydrolase superfamily lysophospholipase